MVTIYVKLLDEGVDVWRPVAAISLGGSLYKIVGPTPDDEIWQFECGSVVRSEVRDFYDEKNAIVATAVAQQ